MMDYNFHRFGVPFQQNYILLSLKSTEICTVSLKNTQQSQKLLVSNLCSSRFTLRSTFTLLSDPSIKLCYHGCNVQIYDNLLYHIDIQDLQGDPGNQHVQSYELQKGFFLSARFKI